MSVVHSLLQSVLAESQIKRFRFKKKAIRRNTRTHKISFRQLDGRLTKIICIDLTYVACVRFRHFSSSFIVFLLLFFIIHNTYTYNRLSNQTVRIKQ